MKKLIYLLIAAVLTGGLSARAERALAFNFTNPAGDADASHVSDFNSSIVNSSTISYGSGLIVIGNRNPYSWGQWRNYGQASSAAGLTAGTYLSFAVTPVSGGVLVTNLTLKMIFREADAGTSVALYSAANGFAAPISPQRLIAPAALNNATNVSFDISGLTISAATEFRVVLYGSVGAFRGFAVGNGLDAGDELVVYAESASGPADFGYTATAHSIKPGEPQNLDIVIRNDGFSATNIVSTLTSAHGSFSVLSGAVTNAALAGGASLTNTFSVQALSNATAQDYATAFNLNIAGYGSDGKPDTANADVAVTILNTASASMDKTGFSAATNGTDSATLTVSNSAAFPLQFTVSSSEAWLTHPPAGTQTLAAGDSINITVTADGNLTPGRRQYTDTLAVSWLNNGSQPNPSNFPVQFDVGPRITPLTNNLVIAEAGGINQIPGNYEPGEVLSITITSTNNGAIPVNNITNRLILPAGWGTPSPASALYPSLAVGDSTSTTYQVTIPVAAADGDYPVTAENSADGLAWSVAFTLTVFNQAIPSVLQSDLTINVPAGGEATGTITLTNAGNAGTTFTLSDNGVWPVSYSVSRQSDSLVSFPPIYDVPDTNTTFINWSGNGSALMNIGFNFPLYGTAYSTFSVSRYGAVSFGTTVGANTNSPFALPSGSSPLAAPFWGNTAIDTNSIRYEKQPNKLVVAWGNRTGHEFQAWLYTNGTIRYLYEQTAWGDGAIGIQDSSKSLNAAYTPGNGSESVVLTPQRNPWVTPSVTNGTLNALSSRVITYTANAAGLSAGTTNTFNVTVTWGDGSSRVIAVKVVVDKANPGLQSPTDVEFQGLAGFITTNNDLLVENIGDVALAYTITDIGARSAGYTWANSPFTDEFINWDSYSKVFIPTNSTLADEGVTVLTPIGFEFLYYGNVYTNLSIGINGGLSLGTPRLMTTTYTVDTDTNTAANRITLVVRTNTLATPWPPPPASYDPTVTPIDNFYVPEQMIAPYWRDLSYDANSAIHVSGDGNKLVVTWVNLRQTGADAPDQTFQAVLYKNGTIRFQYYSIGGGSNTWPAAEIGLRDTASRTTKASLVHPRVWDLPGTVTIETNYTLVPVATTNDDIVYTTNITVVTNYDETVTDWALVFTPAAPLIISVDPASGTLPVGQSAYVTIYGDARGLSAGTSSATTNTLFNIVYTGGTNAVNVRFRATNSVENIFADADEDGMSDLKETLAGTDANSADSLFGVSVTRSADGSRTVSWPKANDNLSRTYVVWYTTSLLSGWTELYRDDNFTSYTDKDHPNVPVIYYKVTVQ